MGFAAFGLVAILGALLAPERGIAQTPAVSPARLTVRPRQMATGRENPAAGEYTLDSLPETTDRVRAHPYRVYIPPKCAGPRRCPLLVHLHGAGGNSRSVSEYRGAADKYGIIILGASAAADGIWAQYRDSSSAGSPPLEPDRRNIDAALRQVLQRFAINPGKIVISGVSNGCAPTKMLGGANMDVFSRVVTFGGIPPRQWLDPPTKTTEFLAIDEFPYSAGWVWMARDVRRAGYRLKHIAALAGHGVHVTTADFVGQWLQESWAKPNPATRKAPRVVASLPVLTPQALAQVIGIWESTRSAVPEERRLAYQREIVVPVVTERPSTVMVDMSALAANSPAAVAALKRAGLTARQFDAYRLALISARLSLQAIEGFQAGGPWALPAGTVVDPASVQGRNIAFVKAHLDKIKTIEGMFFRP